MGARLGKGYTCANCGTYHRTSMICNCSEKKNIKEKDIKETILNLCRLCNGTGTYHIGGSFGGAVQTKKCNCGNHSDIKMTPGDITNTITIDGKEYFIIPKK